MSPATEAAHAAFHRHADDCTACARGPLTTCAVGKVLLQRHHELFSGGPSDAEIAFRFVLGHAETMYLRACAETTDPDEWPAKGAEYGWKGLDNTSKHTFIRQACEDVGVSPEQYQTWLALLALDEDLDAIFAKGLR